jgi:alkanesulfonate monooxygenase SsuD/methylene tetrahydromethanopterin reductase-like flavin-dependent oxidoreductase (luciferase family)
VGINTNTVKGYSGRHAIIDLSAESVSQKVHWVREGAQTAGRDVDQIELHLLNWLVRVTNTAREASDFLERVANRNDVCPSLLAASPSVLVGTADQIADALLERRATYGFSIIQLDAGFPIPGLEMFAPIVDRLAR